MIYITSFFGAKGQVPTGVPAYSAAVYQPKGFSLPKAAWTDIRRDGVWTRPRDFIDTPDPLLHYRTALYELYSSRIEEARAWIQGLDGHAALCCWCPYDKAAKRQLGEWGSFVCHTAVVGEFLTKELKVPVWYDGDRRWMTVLARGELNKVE